jgi:hypothetical protein
MRLSDVEILVWCTILILLEIQHLKWIVWNDWDCRTHRMKNKECRCKAKLMLWL